MNLTHALRVIVYFSLLFPVPMVLAQENRKVDSLQSALSNPSHDTTRFNILIGLYSTQVNQPGKAFEALDKAMGLARSLKDKKKEGQVYSRLAYLYNKTGNSAKAIQQLLSALGIYEMTKDSVAMAAINNNIGLVYNDRGEYAEALNRFEKAISIWEKRDFKSGISRALNNMANIHLLQNNNQKALALYQQTQALCEEMKDRRFTSTVLTGIGRAQFQMNEYDKALDYLQRALAIAEEFGQKTTQTDVLIEQSKIWSAKGDTKKALQLASEALRIARGSQYKMGALNAHHEMADAYGRLNDFKSASLSQQQYIQLKDSLRDSENTSKMQHLASAYELDKKEAEIQLLQQQHRAQLFRRNAWVLSSILLLICAILFFSYWRVKNKRKMDKQRHELLLKEQQLEFLKESLLEKSSLLEKVSLELNQLMAEKPSDAQQIEKYSKILESNILTPEDWENFKKAFEGVYPQFFSAIRYKYPDITNAELRLSALIKLNLSVKESAKMLGVSPESVKQSRYRLKKKLNIGENSSLEDFVNNLQR